MTREEYLLFCENSSTSLPIMLANGRMGLCNHWTEIEILVDTYDEHRETIRVPFADVVHVSGGALMQVRR
jgi:hypothetical protein